MQFQSIYNALVYSECYIIVVKTVWVMHNFVDEVCLKVSVVVILGSEAGVVHEIR